MICLKKCLFFLNFLRFSPHIILLIFSDNKKIIQTDILRWTKNSLIPSSTKKELHSFVYLLTFKKEFRNVFFVRTRKQFPISFHLLNLIAPRLDSLYIPTPYIGAGLFIEHGFSTIIAAKKIGKNCSIYLSTSYCRI